MPDHSTGLPAAPAGVSSRVIATRWSTRPLFQGLQDASAWATAGCLWTGMVAYFWQDEGEGYFLFTAAYLLLCSLPPHTSTFFPSR